MADVLIVCVREDETQAKALADMFEAAGFSVGGAPGSDASLRSSGAGIVVWSQASIRSRPFLDAAQRVVNAEKAVIACLIDPPPPESVGDSPCFDLTGWNGDHDDPVLDPIFFAVDRMVNSARAAVGEAPTQSVSRFAEPPSLRPPPSAPPYARVAQRTAPSREPPPSAALPPGFQMRSGGRSAYDDRMEADASNEAEEWRAIRNSKDPTVFLDFLARYGADSAFAELADLRLKQLESAAGQLRGAARAANTAPPAPRNYERSRTYEVTPPTPQRRPEPPSAYDAPRRIDAAPRPPAQRRDPPRHRDEREYRTPDAPRTGGGGMRMLLLVILLGGGAFAGAVYFGLGDRLQTMLAGASQSEQTADIGATTPPLDEPAGAPGAETIPAAESSVPFDEGTVRAQPARPTQIAARTPQRPETTRAQETDGPPPPPQTNWNNAPAPTPASGSTAGGPVSLLPNSSFPNNPSATVTIPSAPQTVSASTSTTATAPSVLWAQRPTPQRLAATYPNNALRGNLSGSAQLDCVVRADLGVTCVVASETPSGSGFGRAALNAVLYYRARATLSDGSTSVGSRTRVSVSYRAPRQ